MDLSRSHLNTVIQRSGEHTPNAVNTQTYGVHRYFTLWDGKRVTMTTPGLHLRPHGMAVDVPVKQQRQQAEQQGVEEVVEDRRLLSDWSVLQSDATADWLPTGKDRHASGPDGTSNRTSSQQPGFYSNISYSPHVSDDITRGIKQPIRELFKNPDFMLNFRR